MEFSTVASPKSPDTDHQIQPLKALPFTNGVLKLHAPVLYKECMKNHAAAMGGHALDGCGEFFMPSSSSMDNPTSLKCAACGCHRNFHRRETQALQTQVIEYQSLNRHHPPPPPRSPPPISSSAPHMLLALSAGRKRFRSKFSQEQKEKMLEFAEKLGWKMQKASEEMVKGFCSEVGVERGVFKVWMHNNKNTFGRKDHHHLLHPVQSDLPIPAAGAGNDVNGSSGNSGYSKNGDATYGSSTSS